MKFQEKFGLLRTWRDEGKQCRDNELAKFFDFCLFNLTDLTLSQNFQDLFALYVLGGKRNGYFIEFGAVNGICLSNTYMLETQYGWQGILAEPAKIHHDYLNGARRCNIDTRCVWNKSGEILQFNEVDGDAVVLSTIDYYSSSDVHAKLRQNGKKYDVMTVSLLDLVKEYDCPKAMDYLSIDTEGSEFEIISAFPFNEYLFTVITVKHNHGCIRSDIFDLLSFHGYKRKFELVSQCDDWYVRI